MALPTVKPHERIGVLYAPFQVHQLQDFHLSVLKDLIEMHERCVVALPVKRHPPTKAYPLDYRSREQMILGIFGGKRLHVVPVPDRKYAADRVKKLEESVAAIFEESTYAGWKAHLYTEDPFLTLYEKNGGTWNTSVRPLVEREAAARRAVRISPSSPEPKDAHEAFRRGVIYTMEAQYPASIPTVDIAITRMVEGRKQVLLGRKPAEQKFRFPGGYKDRRDDGYEPAVLREGQEETNSTDLTSPRYVGSRNVNDWRYDGEPDGITTVLFESEFYGDDTTILAGDDIGEVRWFYLDELTPPMLEPEHDILLTMLQEKEAR